MNIGVPNAIRDKGNHLCMDKLYLIKMYCDVVENEELESGSCPGQSSSWTRFTASTDQIGTNHACTFWI